MSHHDVSLLCLQIAVLLTTALAGGQLMRLLGLPVVLGELLGGVVLGPTVLGVLAPDTQRWLFPESGQSWIGREAVTKLGMLCFLFVAGLEVDVVRLRKLGRSVAAASVLGIVIPFACGAGLVWFFPRLVGAAPADLARMAFFMGTALSISALPMIARVLMDLGLQRSPVGTVVLAAATIDDLVGWSLFGALLGSIDGAATRGWLTTVLGVLGLAALVLTAGRWAAVRMRPLLRRHIRTPGGLIGTAAVLTLAAATAAQWLGLHAILGAFLAGLALSQGREEREGPHQVVYEFAVGVFAPIYFVSVGLKADFVKAFDPLLVVVVLLVACLGKLAGATLGAWLGGMPAREALAVGFGMNARGAMEMVLATLALEAGLIDERLFVALVTMAMATSVLSAPVMARLLRPAKVEAT